MTTKVTQELVAYFPHLAGHLKQASDMAEVVTGFPTSDIDSTLISALKVEYMEKVSHQAVPHAVSVMVKKAALLYGVADLVSDAVSRLTASLLEKSASETDYSQQVYVANQYIHDLHVRQDVVGLIKVARSLDDTLPGHKELMDNPYLSPYKAPESLDKSSVIQALEKRAFITGSPEYSELKQVLQSKDFGGFSKEACVKVLDAIHSVDSKHHLSIRGCDIYKESLVKVASETFKLGGKSASLEKILEVIPALQDALGKETVKEILDAGPEAGPIIASLPLDLKAVIGTYV